MNINEKPSHSMNNLFENNGAEFSPCRKYRYRLWRIWDESKPLVMFVGLNPSTANEASDDPTIRRVTSLARNLGYGGVYMMNCYSLVSTNPAALLDVEIHCFHDIEDSINERHLDEVSKLCKDVVFAWGNFNIVRRFGRDLTMCAKFQNAKALHINKNGSPKHPLYCKATSKLVPFLHPDYSSEPKIVPVEKRAE
jgi:hypothetical protein